MYFKTMKAYMKKFFFCNNDPFRSLIIISSCKTSYLKTFVFTCKFIVFVNIFSNCAAHFNKKKITVEL